MGISGLHAFLQPYGTSILFQNHDDVKDRPDLVIDGPALAYFLWRQERLKEGDYRRYKKALFDYIHSLQKCFKMVYFDGYLPPHKRGIRLSRAAVNAERVRKNTGSLIHSTPPAAFVVTLTQDLLHSLNVRIAVTREEADVSCARKTRDLAVAQGKECYLLSLDSDLHCFDMGCHGHYLPLDTLLISETSISGVSYNYKHTEELLGVDLVRMAALMGAEGTIELPTTAKDAVRLIKQGMNTESDSEMQRVRAMFSMDQHVASESENTLPPAILEAGHLYGRFCEGHISGELWLPQLLEDSREASAWTVGETHRIAAYRLLVETTTGYSAGHIVEWCRRAERVSAKEIALETALGVAIPSLPESKIDFFVICMKTLLSTYGTGSDALSEREYHAFVIMLLGTYPGSTVETTMRVVHMTAKWQAIIFSITLYCQARSFHAYPILSDLYDMQTFLKASELLSQGHTLQALCKGHEKEIRTILERIDYRPEKRKGKRRRP